MWNCSRKKTHGGFINQKVYRNISRVCKGYVINLQGNVINSQTYDKCQNVSFKTGIFCMENENGYLTYSVLTLLRICIRFGRGHFDWFYRCQFLRENVRHGFDVSDKKIWRGQRLFVFLTSWGFFGGEEAKYFSKRPLINSGT